VCILHSVTLISGLPDIRNFMSSTLNSDRVFVSIIYQYSRKLLLQYMQETINIHFSKNDILKSGTSLVRNNIYTNLCEARDESSRLFSSAMLQTPGYQPFDVVLLVALRDSFVASVGLQVMLHNLYIPQHQVTISVLTSTT
jgi:hypothetical protein